MALLISLANSLDTVFTSPTPCPTTKYWSILPRAAEPEALGLREVSEGATWFFELSEGFPGSHTVGWAATRRKKDAGATARKANQREK